MDISLETSDDEQMVFEIKRESSPEVVKNVVQNPQDSLALSPDPITDQSHMQNNMESATAVYEQDQFPVVVLD